MRPWHIIVLVVAFFLLFGWKRLPDAARAIGRSLRIFKAETKDLLDDDVKSKAEAKKVSQEITPPDPSAASPSAAEPKPVQRPVTGEVFDSNKPRDQR